MAVTIDPDSCIACGACVDACPQGVLEVEDTVVLTDPDGCIDCGACVDTCPVGTLSL